jgi:hypothetical protein
MGSSSVSPRKRCKWLICGCTHHVVEGGRGTSSGMPLNCAPPMPLSNRGGQSMVVEMFLRVVVSEERRAKAVDAGQVPAVDRLGRGSPRDPCSPIMSVGRIWLVSWAEVHSESSC